MSTHARTTDRTLWGLSITISLLIQCVLILGCTLILKNTETPTPKPESKKVTITRDMIVTKPKEPKPEVEPKPEEQSLAQQQEEEKKIAFMRTNEDQESKDAPKDAVFIGQRNTKLGGKLPTNPDGLDHLPSVDGEKKKADELSLLDQRGQDGELEHERAGKPVTAVRPSPATPQEAQPQQQANQIPTNELLDPAEKTPEKNPSDRDAEQLIAHDQTRITPNSEESNDTPEQKDDFQEDKLPEDNESQKEKRDPLMAKKETDHEFKSKLLENIMKTAEKFNLPDPTKPLPPSAKIASQQAREKSPGAPQTLQKNLPRDPAFASDTPGYRQESKKTRITGQMSSSGNFAADVKATPLGAYLSQFLRILNRNWDKECMARRDFIIPGSLKICFVLNKNGNVTNIRLIHKEGASEVQKGFTFKAIKASRIPPMSPSIVKELGEDSTEIIIDFFF